MFSTLKEDIQTVFTKDPAAKNTLEVILCYPGLHAIWLYRIAHWFYTKGDYIISRIISHISRHLTGVEIHPGAKIGRRFFIDHGAGVVIGETSEIGDDVLLYQGVVLGGTSLEKKKRHPTIGNNVLIGAGAIILGPIHIGDGARIAAGSVVIRDVPANATAVGVPARIGLGFTTAELQKLEHGKLPDPIAEAIRFLERQIENLDERMRKVEQLEGIETEFERYVEEKKKEILKMFSPSKEFTEGGGI
ncbi:MAG TPA: serine O-acetyltransferase [Candidatus Omnitrophica bacterium]|nr:serine O-acetyltransferase [Candidatus Omnitrophota bacterium]